MCGPFISEDCGDHPSSMASTGLVLVLKPPGLCETVTSSAEQLPAAKSQ